MRSVIRFKSLFEQVSLKFCFKSRQGGSTGDVRWEVVPQAWANDAEGPGTIRCCFDTWNMETTATGSKCSAMVNTNYQLG